MAEIRVEKRVIDYVGLNIKGIPERYLSIPSDLAPVLALLQGMGNDGAQLLKVDANGNLLVSVPAAGIDTDSNIDEWAGQALGGPSVAADALAAVTAIQAVSLGMLWNGATFDRLRSVSAANLAAQSGLGAALVAPPGQWSVQHSPAVGAVATISRVAGGAGVRNVCTGFGFGFSSGVAVAAQVMVVNLRDGASGAGAILKSWLFSLAAAIIPPFGIEVAGVEIPGTANTAMTLEFTALLANLQEFVNLSGHLAS
jgi:hypothetical protein